ncbi:MAG: MbnP family protein [Bacteroidota bacterium]
MKKITGIIAILVLGIIATLTLQSCEKTDATNLTIHFHSKAGDNDFAFDTPFDVNGVNVKITKAQCYLSGIVFKGESSASDYAYDGYLLLHAGQENYQIGDLPDYISTIRNLNFKVGLDEAANHDDPSMYSSDHPLSSQNPNFAHWSWDSGYRFISLEGTIDTDGDDTYETTLEFHIGGDASLREVAVNGINLDLTSGNQTLTIDVDWLQLLNNLDLATQSITHTSDEPEVAAFVLNNLSSVFSKE